MRVLVNNKELELTLIDEQTGCDWFADFASVSTSDDFGTTEDHEYTMTQDAYDWWADHVAKTKKMETRKSALIKVHGANSVLSVVYAVCDGVEFNDVPDYVNSALDETFGE